jgi:importin subunit beta-1
MAAGTCLGLIANTVLDAVVAPALPFISTNIQNANWRFREAAVFAFGAILEGPKSETLEQIILPAFPILLNHLKDAHPLVKDTSAWTIGRICQLHPRYIYGCLPHLINNLTEALGDEPKIAANACWVSTTCLLPP